MIDSLRKRAEVACKASIICTDKYHPRLCEPSTRLDHAVGCMKVCIPQPRSWRSLRRDDS